MPLSDEEKAEIDLLMSGPQPDSLDRSVNQAVRMGNPDENAKVIDLSIDQQLPIDTVQRNMPEVSARQNVNQIDVESIRSGYPVLADYLRDPTNAAVSLDDIDNLKDVEDTLREDEIGFASNTVRGLVSRTNKLVGDLIEFGGTMADEYRATELPDPGIVIGEDGISWHWELPNDQPSALSVVGEYISEGDAHRVGYRPAFTWENLKGDVTPTNLAGYIVEQGVQSLPDMAATLFTLPAYIASRSQDIAEQRAANDSRDDAEIGDIGNSMVVATAVSLLERIGAKSVFGLGQVSSASDVAKAAAEATLKEGTTEFIQEGVEYYGETVGTRTPVVHDDALDRSLAGLVAGGPFGGGIRGTTASIEAIGNRINRSSVKLAESTRSQEQLDQVIRLAQESKTNERAQDKFKQFLRGAGKERAVYVTAKDVIDLTEQGQSIPAYVVNEAMQNVDGEISIPLEDFALDSTLTESLRPYVRFAPNQFNQLELSNATDDSVQDLIARAAELSDIKTEADEIYESVKDQLLASGRHNETSAKWMSQLVPAYVTVKSDETGLSPREVFERMNFNVVGPLSAPAAPSANVLEQQEPTLEQAQKNDIGLYSQVEKIAISMRLPEWKKPEGVANGNVVWDKIKNSDGVKQEELKWLGLEEFLTPFAGYDFKDHTVVKREDGKYEIKQPIDDFDINSVETIDETGEQIEMTESSRERAQALDKEISVIEKLINCMVG